MNIKFTKLHPDAVVPTKAHPTDAGFDLTAPEAYVIPANGRVLINTGIALDIPLGYFGMGTAATCAAGALSNSNPEATAPIS